MFVRKKKNRSGIISIQVISKVYGKYKVVKTIGSSDNTEEIEKLVASAEQWIKEKQGVVDLDFNNERDLTLQFLANIERITVRGPELLLGKLFDEIGFNQIDEPLFRQLVIARLCFPASKLRTTDYLSKYQFIDVDVHVVYRYLDKLYKTQKEEVQRISYEHTLRILGGAISVVFYDVTTIYFESDSEDELRQTGFSKDGKHQHPQIVLGLLVSIDGYPLAYDIFEGKKFEGHTMLPVIEGFTAKYGLGKLVVIADSGLLSKENIEELVKNDYAFILGARIKNESKTIKDRILSLNLKNGDSEIIIRGNNMRLVVSYSDSRAKKDRFNRERGLKKLDKQVKSGKLTKSSLNNRGYNKFLKLTGDVKISINSEKIEEDSKWDGLKGYLTNTTLTKQEIIDNYGQLWKIEKAFRISKNDLKIRPIYHRLHRRIEAHICIAFVAYKVYKELERLLKVKGSDLSPEKAIATAKTIYSVTATTPTSKEAISQTLLLNEEQRHLANLFHL
jgi:transposase